MTAHRCTIAACAFVLLIAAWSGPTGIFAGSVIAAGYSGIAYLPMLPGRYCFAARRFPGIETIGVVLGLVNFTEHQRTLRRWIQRGSFARAIAMRTVARLFTGHDHRPDTVSAEFMFVDLRGSTHLAELLGDERFSALLRDFFIDISGPINETRGEVCQYIGDAALIVWPERFAGNWLECYDRMCDAMSSSSARYTHQYGVTPEFKAGVHAGRVIITEVGTVQRAHVYHGDVLNTVSRIHSRCNETGFDLLASSQAVASLTTEQRARFAPPAQTALRGKSERVAVLGLGSDGYADAMHSQASAVLGVPDSADLAGLRTRVPGCGPHAPPHALGIRSPYTDRASVSAAT